MRRPLKVGIREQMKASLLMLPSGAEPYDTDDRQRAADMFIVNDGSQTHKLAGTKMGPAAFERTGIARLLARAGCCIINAGPTDRECGLLLVSWAAQLGQCVLIETECSAWVEWARYLATRLGVPPDEVVPDDLAAMIDYSLEQSQSTKH